jgi:hypothetical protein
VPNKEGTVWAKIENKEEVEIHLSDRNVEQFRHAGNTPFGYTDLGKELGHTGDSDMAVNILNGTLEHECMDNEALRAIVGQLKRHPTIQGILKPIVTTADFQSCFKCVPENTASSFSGLSVPHHKAFFDSSKDGLVENLAEIHAAMASIPLETGFCPERHAGKGSWNSAVKQVTDHSVARGGPEPSTTSGFCEKSNKIGAKPQGGHKRSPVWTVSSDMYFADTQQTFHNPNVFDNDAKGC